MEWVIKRGVQESLPWMFFCHREGFVQGRWSNGCPQTAYEARGFWRFSWRLITCEEAETLWSSTPLASFIR